jgi:amicyanin
MIHGPLAAAVLRNDLSRHEAHMKALLDDRRLLLPVLLTALAVAFGSVLIVMLSDDASDAAMTSTSAAPTGGGGAVTVDITDFKFDPISLTVKAGSKVTWINHDNAPHTATASGDGAFDTGTLKKNDTKTVKLTKPGTYAYICAFHPFMKATVIVQ